jgi:dihydroorotase (multifunctional complex type)
MGHQRAGVHLACTRTGAVSAARGGEGIGMARYATRVTGGRVMVRGQLVDADVVIDQGRIIALVRPGESADAAEVIDATGRAVLPGIIDTHAHTREPGYVNKEDFFTASCAAAVGGITTMIDMPNVEPPTDSVEAYLSKRELAAAKSVIDWGHWVAGTNPAEIPKLAAAGVTGYKTFQVSGAYPHDPRLALNDEGRLVDAFRAVAETGLPQLVHPFNQSLFDKLSEDAFLAGKPRNWRTFSEVYTTELIWQTAVGTLLGLQALTGVRLHLVHTHAAGSLRLIRAAKERGQKVTCAIDPKYYKLNLDDLERLTGRVCPAGFVCQDSERMAEIYRSLADGTIDVIDSDHAPHTLEEIREMDVDAWRSAMGSPQYDWQYSTVLTDVAQGKLGLARAVELLCEEPAKLVGVYPQKGVLLPGADADLVIVDLTAKKTIVDDDIQSKCGWSPYVGREVTGYVERTLLRGTTIAKDRTVLGKAGFGEYIAGRPQ